jgi:hypothetical protein
MSVVTAILSHFRRWRNVSGKFLLKCLYDAGAPAIGNAFGIGVGEDILLASFGAPYRYS